MQYKKATKLQLMKIAESFLKDNIVIAPKKEMNGEIVLSVIGSSDEVCFDFGNTVNPPKTFLLPQYEEMFEIKKNRINEKKIFDKKIIFFGIRPCDLCGVKRLSNFFCSNVQDKYFKEKLDNSVFVLFACSKECSSNSFCKSMETGPFIEEGFDAQIYNVDEGYVLETANNPTGFGGLANFTDGKKLNDFKLKIINNFNKKTDADKVFKRMGSGKVQEKLWEDVFARCQVCTGCTNLCPSCSCFNVVDRKQNNGVVRFRTSDSCYLYNFTYLAPNNNSLTRQQTIKRFFEHKLLYSRKRNKVSDCVGCGRCIETCPANISILEFMKNVEK